jgi:hypothetical protein
MGQPGHLERDIQCFYEILPVVQLGVQVGLHGLPVDQSRCRPYVRSSASVREMCGC